jgi:hypothetical protein
VCVLCACAQACGRPWDVVKVTFGLGLVVVVWVVVLVVVLVVQTAQTSTRSAPDNAWPGGGRVSCSANPFATTTAVTSTIRKPKQHYYYAPACWLPRLLHPKCHKTR